MQAHDVDARLRAMGKDRRWLAERTGYTYFTVRDCLAPNGKGISERMAVAFAKALDLDPESGTLPLDQFSPAEKQQIEAQAEREGFLGSQAWIVSKIRVLLAMLRAGPKD